MTRKRHVLTVELRMASTAALLLNASPAATLPEREPERDERCVLDHHAPYIAEAVKARSGPSGLSAYVAAAVARQIERDNLNELIQSAEAEHGPITDEEIQSLRDQLHQARGQQAQVGADAA
jgi:hypothetical protein